MTDSLLWNKAMPESMKVPFSVFAFKLLVCSSMMTTGQLSYKTPRLFDGYIYLFVTERQLALLIL